MRVTIPIDFPGPLPRRHVVRSECHTYDVRLVVMDARVWFECKHCDGQCNPILIEEWTAEREASRVLHEAFTQQMESMQTH